MKFILTISRASDKSDLIKKEFTSRETLIMALDSELWADETTGHIYDYTITEKEE